MPESSAAYFLSVCFGTKPSKLILLNALVNLQVNVFASLWYLLVFVDSLQCHVMLLQQVVLRALRSIHILEAVSLIRLEKLVVAKLGWKLGSLIHRCFSAIILLISCSAEEKILLLSVLLILFTYFFYRLLDGRQF